MRAEALEIEIVRQNLTQAVARLGPGSLVVEGANIRHVAPCPFGRKQAICPLRAGVVTDVEAATKLLLRRSCIAPGVLG
jgi:hypothetical protein